MRHTVSKDGPALRVAVGGLGAIGTAIIRALDAGIPGLELRAASARDTVKAQERLAGLRSRPHLVTLAELAALADVVVECAPASVYDQVATPAIEAGRILVTMSSGALLSRDDLIERSKVTGARIIIPSGGILGLDALKAAAEGHIHSVTLITRKPPRSLAAAPYVAQHKIPVLELTSAELIFQGNAYEAARAFPANANVAATLSLAGIGPTRTRVEIWAVPGLEENVQELRVRSDSADFDLRLSSRPLAENPRTGSLTPKSAIAALRALTSQLQVGS
jgi:aspartate dehydrogenase